MKNRKNEQMFVNYLQYYNKDLEFLQKDIDFEGNEDKYGTLAYIGCNFSYDLAIIGFELGYYSWHFSIIGNFKKIKKDFMETIMSNEKIEQLRTDEELKDIETRILKAKKNKRWCKIL